MKKIIVFAVLLCLLLSSCGRLESDNSDGENSLGTGSEFEKSFECSEPNSENSHQDSEKTEWSPSFAEMPEINADFCNVIIGGNTAIFEISQGGMEMPSSTLISYDLEKDKYLSSLNWGQDIISVFYNGENFAVLSHTTRILSFFNKGLMQISQFTIDAFEGEIGVACLNEDKMLLSSLTSGSIYIYDLNSQKTIKSDAPCSQYQVLGKNEKGFVLNGYDVGLISVSDEGESSVLYEKGFATVSNDRYIAGIQGDYITFLPFESGDAVMTIQTGKAEKLCASYKNCFLSHSQTDDFRDELFLYSATRMTVSRFQTEKKVVSASLYEQYVIAAVLENYGEKMEFICVDFSEIDEKPVGEIAYNRDILNGRVPLPDPDGSEDAKELVKYFQEKYGVRIMWSEDFFDIESIGFSVKPTTEEKALKEALLVEEVLKFVPEGVFKEISEVTPVVIYICDEISNCAGGVNTVFGGYNICFVSTAGNDNYFLSVVAHEIGHCLERLADYEVLKGWRKLMPEEVAKAYENPCLTVEYTPDHKEKTPVWFADAYGRSSEMEDRAVIFSYMFDAYYGTGNEMFNYDGILIKAKYWETILKQTYKCCENVSFSWEGKLTGEI